MSQFHSNLPEPSGDNGGSPFDALRQIDEYGREYWSARRLQPLMGYEKWERFVGVIDRAIRSAENTGTYSDQEFSQIRESSGGPGPDRLDYRLSRTAAYSVAMNGDPNKPQVAAAQAYFNQQTQRAEVLQMPTHATALRGWAAELEAREAAEKRAKELDAENKVLAPKASKWEKFLAADGLIGMRETADLFHVDVKVLTAWLVEVNIFRRATSQSGGARNLPRKPHQDSGLFTVKMENCNGWMRPVAYATSQGLDLIADLWEKRAAA